MNTNFKKAGFKDSINAMRTSATAVGWARASSRRRAGMIVDKILSMIGPLNLYKEINCLISNPACTGKLEVIARSIEYSFNQALADAGKYRSCNRRRNYISGQASRLTRLADQLYLELHFLKSPALARALVLLLGLIRRLNGQLPGTCRSG